MASLTDKLDRAVQVWRWERPVASEQVEAVLSGPSNPGN